MVEVLRRLELRWTSSVNPATHNISKSFSTTTTKITAVSLFVFFAGPLP
jgi:hypothetical protein